jgi:hypothetical protein
MYQGASSDVRGRSVPGVATWAGGSAEVFLNGLTVGETVHVDPQNTKVFSPEGAAGSALDEVAAV